MENRLLGSATSDYLQGDARVDILEGLDGDDYLYGVGNDDVLIGGRGNDYLDGGVGHDRYVFEKGHGRDVIFDEAGTDTIEMQDIDYANLKFAQVGSDLQMSGYSSTDSITFKNFFYPTLYRPETFVFKNQTLSLTQMMANGMHFTGAAGDDQIILDWGMKGIVAGNAGNDTLVGANLNDILDGGLGNDKLYSEGGNDVLIGGKGNDYLEGGLGNDRYVFEKGHGQDVVLDVGGTDTIEMKDIEYVNLNFSQVDGGLKMSGYNGTDSITFQGFFDWGPAYKPETFVFKNQTLNFAQMMAKGMYFAGTSGSDYITLVQGMKGMVTGGAGDDHLSGANLNDTLDGGLGSDVLYGDGGSDTLIGGNGNDYLDGGIGHDRYVFEKGHGQDVVFDTAGSDTIEMKNIDYVTLNFSQVGNGLKMSGYNGADSITFQDFFGWPTAYRPEAFEFKNQTLSFAQMMANGMNFSGTSGSDYITLVQGMKGVVTGGAGNDYLSGANLNDSLDGALGDDVLIGGKGNDYLAGGVGHDSYVFEKGHGQDVVYDVGGTDTIEMQGINYANLQFSRVDNGLQMTGYNGTDSITFKDFFLSSAHRPDNFSFKDQTLSFVKMMANGMNFTGTSGNDSISMMVGMKGIVKGNAGDDILMGANFEDTLDGGLGNDVLIGGGGHDYLLGGVGHDRYVFEQGHGSDYIFDVAGTDTIEMKDIDYANLTFSSLGNDLRMTVYNNYDSITFKDFFLSAAYRPETFIFKDQTIQFAKMMANGMHFTGSSYNDTITMMIGMKGIVNGNAGDDILSGANLNDTLDGGFGNDVLVGGKGNDYLLGGVGHDRYVFEKGHGQDVIFDAAGTDTIEMKDIDYANLKFVQINNDWRITGYNGTDSITFKDFFLSSAYRPETFIFKDQALSFAQMMANGVSFTGGAGNDVISLGVGLKWVIHGNAGNDTLTGGNLDDTLVGGLGNDSLYGGTGDDRYVFEKGHGQDVIFDAAGVDTIEMKDINYANLKFAKLNNDLRMMGYNGTDSITFKDFFLSSANWPKTFIFKDQSIGFEQMMANGMSITGTSGNDLINIVGLGIKGELTGNAGDDYLVGGFSDDTLIGGTGNDYLAGDFGNDRYVFEKGHGKDIVSDNVGTDTFVMNGIDYTNVIFKYVEGWENRNDLVMSGYNGSDSIVFKDVLLSKIHKNKIFEFKDKKIDLASILATDGVVILGTAADDTLFASNDTGASIRNVVNGYGGNDSLYGNSFKDTLNGGQGHDTLLGYGGDDVLNGEEDRDSLWGLFGSDKLNGGVGDDFLFGGDGNDYYLFEKGHGQDEIVEYTEVPYGDDAGIDTIVMSDYIKQDLWFSSDGHSLFINGAGRDQIQVRSHYAGQVYQVEFFAFANGEKLNATAVNHLVNSMAAFASQQTTNLSTSELRELYWANYATV